MKIVSLGHRCHSASIIKKIGSKTESYPFDWLISKLDTIKKCIDNNFVHFKKKSNYKTKITSNDIGITENVSNNIEYEKENSDIVKTYDFNLACNHYNLENNYYYYERCVDRFMKLLESNDDKMFLYIHPILTSFQPDILDVFEDFTNYMSTRTKNFFIVYFILSRELVAEQTSFKYKNHHVYVVHCNAGFCDTGCPFEGDSEKETNEIISILKTYDILDKSIGTHTVDNCEIFT